MPSREQRVPIEVLREAVRQEVSARSLRPVAADVGMSWRGLSYFVEGREPRPSTRRKLTDWYVKRAAGHAVEADPDLVAAALDVLLRHLPPELKVEAERRIARAVDAVGEQHRIPPPGWLSRLLTDPGPQND